MNSIGYLKSNSALDLLNSIFPSNSSSWVNVKALTLWRMAEIHYGIENAFPSDLEKEIIFMMKREGSFMSEPIKAMIKETFACDYVSEEIDQKFPSVARFKVVWAGRGPDMPPLELLREEEGRNVATVSVKIEERKLVFTIESNS